MCFMCFLSVFMCFYCFYQVEKEEVEALLPKGATELTKQQIRYLLQVILCIYSTLPH